MNNKSNRRNPVKNSSVGQALSGKYKVMVLDQNDNIVWEQKDWAKNLILNQGMDALAPGSLPTRNVKYANAFAIASMGDGARYNSIPIGYNAGEGSASLAGGNTVTFIAGISGLTNLTASAGNGYSSAVEVGDMIQFDDGTEARVTSLNPGDTATVTAATANTATIQPFTIWKTSQVGLQSVLHRVGLNNAYINGSSYNGTSFNGNLVQMRRSWDFNYQTASVVVREVGVGWSTNGSNYSFSSGQSNVFSRVVLPTTTSLSAGQKLRLIYELDISIYPNVTTGSVTGIGYGLPFTASIGGSNPWPVSPSGSTVISSSGGYYNVQAITTSDISWVDTNGDTQQSNAYLEPSNNVVLFWSDSAAQLQATGNSTTRASGVAYDTVTATSDPYSSLSFTCTKTGTFAAALGSQSIRSFGIQRATTAAPSSQCFACLFFQPQQKSTIQTLSLTFQYTWGRTLA